MPSISATAKLHAHSLNLLRRRQPAAAVLQTLFLRPSPCVLPLQAADKLEHVATEHFWMSGLYWGLTAMELLGRLHQMDTAKVLDWVRYTLCCLTCCFDVMCCMSSRTAETPHTSCLQIGGLT